MIREIFAPSKFTGWHMAGVLGLFFGTIITVNMTLAWFANSTWTGLVVKNSYVASQSFDADTKALQQQVELGWQLETDYQEGSFSINLADAANKAVTNAIAVVKLGRPATEADDRTVNLDETRPGRYDAMTELPAGIWQADISVSTPTGLVWQKSVRFTVKG